MRIRLSSLISYGISAGASKRAGDGRRAGRARESAPRQSAGSEAGRFPYVPAIDGLRAVAVIAVLLYHSGLGWLPGGFLGVEVFFVISGYLITSMLLGERSRSGSVDVGAFWIRRARRLLPAVFALIVGMLVYAAAFLPEELTRLRWDALAAAGYVSNWYQVFHHESYFESLGRPSLLRHLWSLAVEEQFYLLWPVAFALVIGRLKPRYGLLLVVAGALASTMLMALRFEPGADPSRLYYGTDTRAGGLLAGAALAFVRAPGAGRSTAGVGQGRLFVLAGCASLAGLLLAFVFLDSSQEWLYRGGFAAVALATAILIACLVRPASRVPGGLLSWRPLVWVGLRSYAVYLWHWPVFMLTRPYDDVPLDGLPLLALRLLLTLALAEVSYRLVESPVRGGALGREWQRLQRALPGRGWTSVARHAGAAMILLGLVSPLGVAVIGARPPALPSYLPVERVRTGKWVSPASAASDVTDRAVRLERTPEPAPSPSPVPSVSTVETNPESVSAVEIAGAAPAVPVAPIHVSVANVTAIGDSVMLGTAGALSGSIEGISVDAAVGRQVSTALEILRGWRDAGMLGDVMVVHLGTNGYFTSGQFDQMMQILAGVRLVVFINIKVPRDWEGDNNAVLASGVARYPNTVLVDWHSASVNTPELFWGDGIHVRPEGAQLYANLVASVLAAHPAPTPEPAVVPAPEPTAAPTAPPTAPPTPVPTPVPAVTPTPVSTSTPGPSPGGTPAPSPAATHPPGLSGGLAHEPAEMPAR